MTAWLSPSSLSLPGSASSAARPLSSSLFAIFPLPRPPSPPWQPNLRTFQNLSPKNSPHPKNLPQNVPFLPDLPPSTGPKIRKFNQPHLRSPRRPVSLHHPNPTITLAPPPSPPFLLPRPLLHLPPRAPAKMVSLNPIPRCQIRVGVHSKGLPRRLRKA